MSQTVPVTAFSWCARHGRYEHLRPGMTEATDPHDALSSWELVEAELRGRSHDEPTPARRPRWRPEVAWKWQKWTFGAWRDMGNKTAFGIDVGPLEITWRVGGYRP